MRKVKVPIPAASFGEFKFKEQERIETPVEEITIQSRLPAIISGESPGNG